MVLKKKLDENHTLIRTVQFPYYSVAYKRHKVLLGIGGNIGDVLRRFRHLFDVFKHSAFLDIVETTPIVKNPPFGYLEQKDFYNALILIETNLSPKALLRYVLGVEKQFGRRRSFKDAPRTLDIDIIFYENIVMHSKHLILPHPYWNQRSSVLLPLQYLRTDIRLFHPLKMKQHSPIIKINKYRGLI